MKFLCVVDIGYATVIRFKVSEAVFGKSGGTAEMYFRPCNLFTGAFLIFSSQIKI